MNALRQCCIVIKGTLVRILFSVLAGLCVWLVSDRSGLFWMMWLVFLCLMFLEGLYTLCFKEHGSWKWFSPTIALLLLCTVPCLWIIELEIFQRRRECYTDGCDLPMFNKTLLPPIFGYQFPYFSLSLPDWSLVLHQLFLFALILGRWLLPKGELTRDQLSQLLLVQIGMAADILEFIIEGTKVEGIYGDNMHVLLILGVWSLSLPQFTLSLTLTKGRKRRVAGVRPLPSSCENRLKVDQHEDESTGCCHIFCGTEVWAILVTMAMQDVPFLATRLYLIFSPNSVQLSIPFLFFTFKNALLSSLQLYRLFVILREYRRKRLARIKRSFGETPPSMDLDDVTAAHGPPPLRLTEAVSGSLDSTDPNQDDVGMSEWVISPLSHDQNLRNRRHVRIQTDLSLSENDFFTQQLSPVVSCATISTQMDGWSMDNGIDNGRF